MQKPPKVKQTYNDEHFYDLKGIVSATDCTGLIPAAQGEDELILNGERFDNEPEKKKYKDKKLPQ